MDILQIQVIMLLGLLQLRIRKRCQMLLSSSQNLEVQKQKTSKIQRHIPKITAGVSNMWLAPMAIAQLHSAQLYRIKAVTCTHSKCTASINDTGHLGRIKDQLSFQPNERRSIFLFQTRNSQENRACQHSEKIIFQNSCKPTVL